MVRVADRPKASTGTLQGDPLAPKKANMPKAKDTKVPAKPKTKAASPKASTTNHLERIRALCLAYPESTEVVAWGHPTFRVRDKIFASTGFDGTTLGVKATHEQQADLVSSDPRFSIADYVGKHGWVTMSLAGKVDFGFVESLIKESYRLVAPKTLSTPKEKAQPTALAPKKPAAKRTTKTSPAPLAKKAAKAKAPSRAKLVKSSPAKRR